MTFGLLFNTVNGERVIDEEFPVPQFLGKVSLVPEDNFTSATPEGHTQYAYKTSAPIPYAPTSAHLRLILWSLPDTGGADCWYWPRDRLIRSGTSYALAGMYIYRNGSAGGGLALPEGYVFMLGPASNANQAFGLQLFDSLQQLIFDSGNMHLAISSVVGGINYPESGIASAAASMSSKGAFLLPDVARFYRSTSRFEDEVYREWLGVIRRSGGALQTRQIWTYDNEHAGPPVNPPSVGTASYYAFGNPTGHTIPLIDATLYD